MLNARTLTIKNIPEPLYLKLKESAAQHHRSLNKEVIIQLEERLISHKFQPEALLTKARELRSHSKKLYLTEKKLQKHKRSGLA